MIPCRRSTNEQPTTNRDASTDIANFAATMRRAEAATRQGNPEEEELVSEEEEVEVSDTTPPKRIYIQLGPFADLNKVPIMDSDAVQNNFLQLLHRKRLHSWVRPYPSHWFWGMEHLCLAEHRLRTIHQQSSRRLHRVSGSQWAVQIILQ